MGDIINAGADLLGFGPASKQADAARYAADISSQAQREALALQQRMYEEGVARQQPWLQAGTGAINQLAAGLSPGGKYATPFSQTNWMQDPGYAFRMSEGLKALDRQAAARGGLISGAALKAAQGYGQQQASQLTRYGQEFGSEEFGKAYNRLASIASLGPSAAGVMNSLGSTYGQNANALTMTNAANQGNLALQAGNIRASQYGNYGNALNTALNTDWKGLGDRAQAAFSQTGMGQSGFGTGAAYGNQDYGQYF